MVGSVRPENIITRVESNNITSWQQFTNGFCTEQFKFPYGNKQLQYTIVLTIINK